ncbi:MAG: hypothetical protein FJW35_05145 [Acidobacteria bacterium]|nr:hypothetical protein [Acidobacteriota bacterium]
MPAKNALGSHDGGKPIEHLAAEDLAFDGKPASLAVVEENSFLSELLPEYPVLSEEVLEGVRLPAIDPAGEDEEQQVPWLKPGFHVPPDARFRSGGSGIADYFSRVAPSGTCIRGKTRRHNRLRLG